MKSTLLTYIDRFRQNRRERLVLGSVLLFLAVIVSLIVYWQLRYTGITMSNETFCGYEEHVHTEECYDEEGNLVCELEEHTHTVGCLINLNADVEDASIWKATLPELTGDLRTDVVNIAYSQLGYTESTANFSPGEDGVTRYGYTRYGAWYGNEYGTWDAMFVSFCLNYAGVDRTAFPLNSGAYSWAVELSEIGSYAEASAYTPLAGDIVFFDTDLDGRIDRVGIVASTDISGGVVTIIEGDYTVSEVDTVCEHIYALNDPTISGYGIIAVSEEVEEETEETEAEETADETEDTEETEEIEIEETEDTEETEEETEESPTLFYTASDSGVNVTVIAPEGALPDGAILSVSLLDEESDEYAEAAEAVGYEDGEDTGMAALDITFYDELGIEVEPALPVTVTVDITEIIPEGTTADTIEVTHITDTEVSAVETLVETVTDTTDETAVVVFETESFSTFTLQWTYTEKRGPDTYTYTEDVTVYVYDTDGNEITVSTSTVSLSSGVPQTLSTLLEIDGYTFNNATIKYTYQDRRETVTAYVYYATSITYSNNNSNGTYTFVSSTSGTSSPNSVQSVEIYLYYAKSSASITINKYETGTTTQLSGAMFTLTSSVSLAGVTSDGSFTLSDDGYTITFTTTSSAIKFSNLPEGNYTLTETSAPSGYTKADESFTFTVSGTSIESASISTDGSYTYSSNAVSFYDDPEPTYTFDIVWHASGASSLNVSISSYFDTNGNGTYVLDDGTLSAVDIDSTLYVGYNNEVDFDDNNALLAVSGYTLNSATLYVNGSTTGITDVASLRSVYDWNNKVWTYSYLTTGSSTWVTLSNVTSLAVDLYYEIEDTAITGDLTISDDVANSGSIVATYTGSGTVDHYIWYQYDSDSGTWSQVSGEYGDSLEVYEDGARQTYRVEAVDSSGNVLATSASFLVPYYDQLQNGSFEYPAIDTSASGNIQITNNLYYEYVWQTTGEGTGNKEGQDLELINASTGGSDYGETTAADGNQYAELNCEATGTLYQDVMTIPDVPLYWNFAHEGRGSTDSMCVIIVDASYAETNITTQDDIDAIYAAAVQAASGSLTAITEGEYSTGITFTYDGVTITLWLLTSDSSTWHYYYGEYTVPDNQYLTRFLFASVSGTTTGNLIDGISFSQTAPVSDDSVNVTVTKVVSGLDEDEVVAAGTYTFEVYNSNGNSVGTIALPFANATASQTAYWTYTFTELTADSGFYIVETINNDISGYTYSSTSCVISTTDGIGTYTSASFALSNGESSVVTFTNNYTKDETYSGGPEMPQTGGRGTKLYTMVGLLLICSGGYLLYRKQRRKCKWRWNI